MKSHAMDTDRSALNRSKPCKQEQQPLHPTLFHLPGNKNTNSEQPRFFNCLTSIVRETNKQKIITYSRNLLLWILVMVDDAIGLPMPELAGEPCDTGVIQYGEF